MSLRLGWRGNLVVIQIVTKLPKLAQQLLMSKTINDLPTGAPVQIPHLVSTEWGVQSRDWELEVAGHSFEWWLQGREGACQRNSLLPRRKLRNLPVYICKSGLMIPAVTGKEHRKQVFAPFFHCFNLLLKWTRRSPESLAFCL